MQNLEKLKNFILENLENFRKWKRSWIKKYSDDKKLSSQVLKKIIDWKTVSQTSLTRILRNENITLTEEIIEEIKKAIWYYQKITRKSENRIRQEKQKLTPEMIEQRQKDYEITRQKYFNNNKAEKIIIEPSKSKWYLDYIKEEIERDLKNWKITYEQWQAKLRETEFAYNRINSKAYDL